ncbi:hypothetical protein, conserved [Eimeria praecox]|uniref:Uncharacterized protein n=1 Tax=Eimeria praecox TaxID=51316 RepID=U6GZ12_9EIME|nr:hypothetical protein, conserved [Eimeria praecox]
MLFCPSDELISGLRAKGYVLSASNDLNSLMDNKQNFATWIQLAVTTQVERVDNKLMQTFKKKGLRIDQITSVKQATLSSRKITYQEWLKLSGGIHFSEASAKRNVRRTVRSKEVTRGHEVRVWAAIAEALYKAPETPWRSIKEALRAQEDTRKAVSVLGIQAVKRLYYAIKTLHQAVEFVDDKAFKSYGAYAITNLIVGYLREKGIFVAGNSGVTLRSIRQAKSFTEWRQDIFLLKVSRELTGPPISPFLVSELKGKKIGAILFRRIARGRLISLLIRSLVRKTVGWVSPYALRYWMSKLGPKDGNEDSRRIGSMLVSAAVMTNCYLNLDYTVLTSVLPAVLGVMESQATRSLVEHIFANANIPRILSRTLLGFAADIEDAVLNVVLTDFLDPKSLNDNVLRWTGVNFNLQNLNFATSLATIASYAQQSVRRHAPMMVENALRVVVEPLANALSDFASDLSNTFLSVGAKELPSRALSRPPTVHAELVKYYLEASRVMDSEGQKYVYEAFVTAFNDQVLGALNPLKTVSARAGRSPMEKIIFNTAMAPFEGVAKPSMFTLWGQQWQLETKDYRMQFYTPVQSATYGLLGCLKLQAVICGSKVTLSFFVESMSKDDPSARKILKQILRRPLLRFVFAESSNRQEGTATIGVFNVEAQGQLLAVLATRQKPVMAQSFNQVDFVHSINAVLTEYVNTNAQRMTSSLSSLNSVFKGISQLSQIQKNAETFKANSLFPLLLEYEYYTQSSWFSIDFHIVMNSPAHVSGPMQLTIIPKGSSAHQKEQLALSWVERGRLQTITLPVRALNRPSTDLPARDRKEASLGRQTVRTLNRVMDAEAANTGTLVYPSLQASRKTATSLSGEDLEAMCPDQTKLQECEQRYGMWGSLFFQEPKLPLGKAIARKRMASPFLFKYWRLDEPASSAKIAIADIEDLERYKHAPKRTHNVQIMGTLQASLSILLSKYKQVLQEEEAGMEVRSDADIEDLERYKHAPKRTHNVQIMGTLQASISILLSKYKQVLQEEEAGMEVRSDHKFQLMKYMHLLMRDVLKEGQNPNEEVTTASLTSALRSAGYEVLVRLPSSPSASLEEEKERFGALEGMTEMLYKDLQLPVRSMHLRALYALRVKLYESAVHLPFATKMIRSNPLAMSAGFQLFPTDHSIRRACRNTGYCPHSAVMWNHVYVTLLVLAQLIEKRDAVGELLAADSFSQVTGQERAEGSSQQLPVTFEESFIAFKTGLGHLVEMRDSIPDAEPFFSSPLSSQTIMSLLKAFSGKDENFRILLLHLPPSEVATVLSSNHREALQDSTWNAFIALWSFQEVYGRLEADVSISMTAFPSFAPPSVLSNREDSGFWMPQCILDPLHVKIQQLFAPLSAPVGNLKVLRKSIDSALHDMRPRVRRVGYISYSDPQILSLWWTVMNIALEHYPGLETEIESFFRSPDNTKTFSLIIQEAAAISAFVSQLQMTHTKAVLVREPKRFGFESWTTLVWSFKTERPSAETVNATLNRIYLLACRHSIEDLVVFRSIIDAISLRLLQLGKPLPDSMTHYPICKAIREASCADLKGIKDAMLSKSCQELEVVRQVVMSRIPFSSPDFCKAMREAEEPLMERCECSESGRNFSLLRTFFVDYMTEQLESSAIKDQWAFILKKQFLNSDDPNIFPLEGNALAATLHEASISLAEKDPKTAEQELHTVAVDVYETMCNFVDYMISTSKLKDKNVCKLMDSPPEPLVKLLKRTLEAHMTRIQLGRFSLTMQPISTLSLPEIFDSKDLQKHPASALKVGVLRFIQSYFSKDTNGGRQGQAISTAYQKVQKEFANIFNLIADRLIKLRPKFASWQQKVIESLRLLVDYAVKMVLNSAKEMTYFSKTTVASQQADLKVQLRMKQRLQGLTEESTKGIPYMESEQSTEAGDISPASMTEIESEEEPNISISTSKEEDEPEQAQEENAVVSTLRRPSIWKHSSLLQLTSPASSEEKQKQGKGTLGLVKLMASMLLADIPRLISGVVPVILPSIWFSIAGVLRVKKSVVGSVKDTAEKVCIRVLDSIVLPSLISTNALVPEALIKMQLVLLARNIHFSAMPEASKVENDPCEHDGNRERRGTEHQYKHIEGRGRA